MPIRICPLCGQQTCIVKASDDKYVTSTEIRESEIALNKKIHHGHPLISDFRYLIVQLVTRMHDSGMSNSEIAGRLRIEDSLVNETILYYRMADGAEDAKALWR